MTGWDDECEHEWGPWARWTVFPDGGRTRGRVCERCGDVEFETEAISR